MGIKKLEDVRILVVDDSEDIRFLLCRILIAHGAAVTSCGSVGEALESLDDTKFDVIVSDICMPEQDGYDLIRILREAEKFIDHPTPAIAVSALPSLATQLKSLSEGYQVHLCKPVNPKVLVQIIERLKELDGEAVRAGFHIAQERFNSV
ncbi:MAG: response regulator [Oligoflexales bacterium]